MKAGVRRRFTNHNRDSDKAARRTRRRTPEAATAQAGRRRGRDSVPQRAPDEGRRPLSVTGPARPSQGGHHDSGRRNRSRRVGGGQAAGQGRWVWWGFSRMAELAGVYQCGPRRGCWDRRAPRKGSGPADVPELLLPCLRCACRAGRCWQLRLPGPSDVPLRRLVHFAPLQTLGSRGDKPFCTAAAWQGRAGPALAGPRGSCRSAHALPAGPAVVGPPVEHWHSSTHRHRAQATKSGCKELGCCYDQAVLGLI